MTASSTRAGRARPTLLALLAAGVAAAPFACSKPPPPAVGTSGPPAASSAGPRAPRAPYPTMAASKLAPIAPGFTGPYLASRGETGVAVYGVSGQGGELAWSAVPLGANGAPKGAAKALGKMPAGVTLAVVRPLGASGFVLVTARTSDRGPLVEATPIGEDGGPLGQRVLVHQASEPVIWADAAPSQAGAHVVLATTSGREGALRTAVLDAKGTLRGPSSPLAAPASAWQVARTSAGTVVAWVTPGAAPAGAPGAPAGAAATGAKVMAQALDEDGRPRGAASVVADGVAEPDLDMVAFGERAVIGWTDRAKLEGKVVLAAIDGAAKVVVPAHAPLLSAGEQAFVGLAASNGADPRVLVAWDDVATHASSGRKIQLSSLRPDLAGEAGHAVLSVGVRDEAPPMLAGTPDGFVALSLAVACKQDATSCAGAQVLPVVVRMGTDLATLSSTPLVLEPLGGDAPEAAWGLTCGARGCFAAAMGETDVMIAELEGPAGPWQPAVKPGRTGAPPAAQAVTSIARGPRIASGSSARMATGTLLATVTEHHEGAPPPALPPDVDARSETEKDRAVQKDPRRGSRRGAIVSVTPLDAQGKPSQPATLSVRALSVGGVAIAPGQGGKDACVAWVARDDGDPQVFLTRVGPDGKRQAQEMLTREKGDVADVAIAAVDDGWIVAWVDGRDGNGEVYAARVDHGLRKKGPAQRITQAPGDAAGPSLLVREKEALVAFSDARGSKDATGDVFLARLGLEGAKKLGEETRLASTPEHGRSVHLVQVGTDAAVVWIDQAPGVAVDARSVLSVAWLDAASAMKGQPESIALEGVSPRGLGLSCEGSGSAGCRVAITHPDGEGLALSAFGLRRGEAPIVRGVLPLFARAGTAIEPLVIGDTVLVPDDGSTAGEGRLRRITMRWRLPLRGAPGGTGLRPWRLS